MTGQDIVDKAMTQKNKPYIYGYEVRLDDPNPKAFDCSELVQWVCHQIGVKPEMPDGAIYQYYHCRNYETLISLKEAIRTPGALLFRIAVPGLGNHVIISRGDGYSIEAKGRNYGVGCWPIRGRTFNHAAKMPGVEYPEKG